MQKLEQPESKNFIEFQKTHFEEAERLRFQWQTTNPLIQYYEKILLTDLNLRITEGVTLLEVGCGEGANLANLETTKKIKLAVGVDFSQNKSRFWLDSTDQANVAETCAGLCGDATSLPLASASFDLVFCRDLLHHIAPEQQAQVVAEMFRVCRPGGHVLLIESNGRNPIIFLHGLLIKAERGEWRSSPTLFKSLLLKAGAKQPKIKGCEPLPVFRLLLHYQFGIPTLGKQKWIAQVFRVVDKVAGWILPVSCWSYVIAWSDVPAK
ncbi:MAG: class I SAM-dependent methyltransferase [Chloroflexota bacterium]